MHDQAWRGVVQCACEILMYCLSASGGGPKQYCARRGTGAWMLEWLATHREAAQLHPATRTSWVDSWRCRFPRFRCGPPMAPLQLEMY